MWNLDYSPIKLLIVLPNRSPMNPFLKKSTVCLVAGLTGSALLLVLGHSGTIAWFPPIVVFSLVGLVLLSSLAFPVIWQYKEQKGTDRTDRVYAVMFALIKYSVAFNIASFGWKKIFGLQFIVSPEVASRPMNQQPGEILTWFYFGYSPTFGLLIAITQLVGAYFLLYRRTFLLSTLVLFTLMLNIALVDIFYRMNAGALIQAVVLTIGLLFLLLSEHRKLTEIFIRSAPAVPSVQINNSSLRQVIRLSAILLSLLFTYYIAIR